MVMGVYAAVHFGWWEWEGRERRDGDIWKCTFSMARRIPPVRPTGSFLFEVTVPKRRYVVKKVKKWVGWGGGTVSSPVAGWPRGGGAGW